MKNILKKIILSGAVLAALILVGSGFSVRSALAQTANFWTQNATNVLSTNTSGGLATADIHVAHCYIGTSTSTPCGGGGGGSGTVTSVATTAPITGGTFTTSGTIGITKSATSTDGYLSSTDWNTFNNKLSSVLASADIFVGSAGNVATATPVSGDATISNAGALTIGNNKITYAKIQQTASSTLIGNPTGSTANVSQITLGSGLAFSGTTLIATGGGGTIGGSIANTQIPFGTGTNTVGGSALLTWTPSPSTITPAVLSVLNGAGNPFFVADSTLRKVSLGDSANAVNGTKLIVDDGLPIITAGIGTKNYLSLEANIQSFGDTTGNAFLESVPVSSALSAFVGGVQALKLDGSALQYSLGNLSGTLATVDDTAHTITLNATSGVVIPHAAVKISGLAYTFPSSFGSAGSVLTDTSGSGSLSWLPAGAGSVSIGSPIGSSTAPNILFIGSGGLLAQDNNFTYNSPSNVFNVGFAGNSFLSINHATNTYAMGAISAGSGNQTNISVNDTNQTFTLSSSSGMASLVVPQTITSPTTTGSVTINKMSGSVNFGVGMSTLTLTDSLVTPNSDVQCTIGTADPVMFGIQCIPGAGNVNMIVNNSPVSTAKVNFFITN